MTATLRRARIGVVLLFMTNGMIWANLAPRYPDIRRSLELSYSQFGTAVMFGGLGAIVVGLTAAAIIRRFTSRLVSVVSMIMMASAAWIAVVTPSGIWFAAALFLVGAIDSIVDVAQNAHGLRVQREYKRTIVNSFHAMWSIGAVVGGLMGGIAAGLRIPLEIHFAVVTALVLVLNIIGYRLLLTGPDTATAPSTTAAPGAPVVPGSLEEVQTAARAAGAAHSDTAATATTASQSRGFPSVTRAVWLALGALSVVAVAGAWVEDAGISWSASYLRDELGTGPTVASLGFVSLMFMHFVGRIIGDRLIDTYGQRMVVRVGGLISAVGMGLALVFPSVPLTIIGFGLAGLGVATTIPAAMHAADELPGFRPGTGLTIVSWILRVGFMLSPPLVGLIADATSLRVGLTLVVIAGVITALFAAVMSNSTSRQRKAVPD